MPSDLFLVLLKIALMEVISLLVSMIFLSPLECELT